MAKNRLILREAKDTRKEFCNLALDLTNTFIGDLPAGEGETEVICRAGDAVKKDH